MDSDQIKKIICKRDEDTVQTNRALSIVENYLKNKPKLVDFVHKFGFGMRKPYELAEDFGLQTPLE
jgi:hypothetical protein